MPIRAGRLEIVRAALTDLEVAELPFPPSCATNLASLRVSTGLKMRDCCLLLAAEAVGARVASFDDRLLRAAGAYGLDVVRQ